MFDTGYEHNYMVIWCWREGEYNIICTHIQWVKNQVKKV